MPTPTRQLCVLLHDGHVLTDDRRRVPAFDEDHRHAGLEKRAVACGDPTAVAAAPQLLVHEDPMVLLTVFTPRGASVEGTWTPVADLAEDEAVVATLSPVVAVLAGHVSPPARRPAWFRPGWYDEAERWLDDVLAASGSRRAGPVEPVKVGMLSAVLRVRRETGPALWFKASCRHFHAEPALTRLVGELLPDHTPRVVATDDDRGWTLLEELPGADEQDPPAGKGVAAAVVAATLQLRSLDRLSEIEAAGVPRRDLSTTARQLDDVLTTSLELDELTADQVAAARATRDRVHAVLAELDGLGIPDTLVHGDLHTGNVAHVDDRMVLYDWSDAAVSQPFLDVVHLAERLPDDERVAAFAAYLEVWRTAYPALDVARALELAERVDAIYQVVTFEHLNRAGEDASFWEMRGVVSRTLRALPDLFPDPAG